MPSLFRRRSTEAKTVEDVDEVEEIPADAATEEVVAGTVPARRGYTPSKKELGLTTPKRPSAYVRRPTATGVPRSRKGMTREERQEVKEARRERRREVSEGMRRGDERYLTARDRGPERAIARDVVDSRRTVGTWFFAGALIVLLGSSAAMPEPVRLVSNLLWAVLAVAVIVDSVILCRRVKRLVRQRHPDSSQRMGSLYGYVVMRGLTFRKLRVPLPRVKIGEQV